MNRKNIIYILLSVLVLGLVVGLVFCFDNTALVACKKVFVFYLIAKILFALGFVYAIAYGLMKERARGTYYPMVVSMLVLQLIPMLMRTYVGLTSFQTGACLITVIVCAMIMVVFLGVMPGVSKVQLEADEKSEAKTIEVKEDMPDKF